ncbi:DNA-binding transcriptional regulator, MurR/RpiR family, contains HTH and SIS domains [Kosakonia arachidis]|uniref:DNA-binding transcriptional regulator, MurR/RpiR family, contains HTH and SIS domains n=1 Tax=Kosakonia arachidis TaxID=551989 RepID=A0A1I6YBQ3_9ENTR|nr:MurR/RpiR family transcriptional regulator [Kosakonia arachidis]SFT47949.1 DNA-binding transcriptional regulator, MurR/RpiR family, contains HTH and SIS domains [Kosakonia arachidis]
MDLLWHLQQPSQSFDTQESKLAQFILNNLPEQATATRESLIIKTGVSPDVLSRFALSAGCRDLDDFFLQLRQAGQLRGSEPKEILDIIRNRQAVLSQQESRVASTILKDLEFAASATIEQLASRAKVSAATITRFARSVGCDDIRDLRMRLAFASAHSERVNEHISPQLARINVALQQQWQDGDTRCWQQAAIALRKARSVLMIGAAGPETLLVGEVIRRLKSANLNIIWIPDDSLLRMTISRLQPDDLLLILAPDVSNNDVDRAVHHAQIQHIPVIAFCPPGQAIINHISYWLPLPEDVSMSNYGILFALDQLESALLN